MAKIQSRNSSTKSTKLGISAPKAPSFTKEQSAYVAGLLTGRGGSGSFSFGISNADEAIQKAAMDQWKQSNELIAPAQDPVSMQQPLFQARLVESPAYVPPNPADARGVETYDPALYQEAATPPSVYAQARDPATTDPPEDLIAIWPWLKKVINGEPTQVPTGPVELPQEVQPGLDEYGMAMQAMRQSESDAQARALQSIRGTEVYDPALSRGVTKHISQGPPIDYQPNLMERFLDTIDPVLSGKHMSQGAPTLNNAAAEEARVAEEVARTVQSHQGTSTAPGTARASKVNPAQGKIETPEDAVTFWASALPPWLEPTIEYDENNEPYVKMHAAVMQRMVVSSTYGGMMMGSQSVADQIEAAEAQGVSPDVAQGTRDVQYTHDQLQRTSRHIPYGYLAGQGQRLTTQQDSPYEQQLLPILQQQYPQLSTEEILRILRGQ